MLLYRRYGYSVPTFKNHMCAFGTLGIYQLAVLANTSIATKVNLNFALCHSHADPLQPFFGYHYIMAAPAYLNFNSYLCRWVHYATILPVKMYYDFFHKSIKETTP